MTQIKRFHFLIACIAALSVFVAYQTFYGDKHNQAYASLSEEESVGLAYVNYKPARKRQLRSRLGADIGNLLDLKGHDVIQIFDSPEMVRRDLPTTIWQYRNDACVMDVYFTVGSAGDVARANVAHYEVRARDTRSKKDLNVSDCIENLVQKNITLSLIDVSAIYKASSK